MERNTGAERMEEKTFSFLLASPEILPCKTGDWRQYFNILNKKILNRILNRNLNRILNHLNIVLKNGSKHLDFVKKEDSQTRFQNDGSKDMKLT